MNVSQLDIPWHKYGLITYLAKRLERISPQFGRTVLQKMIYILEEVFDIPCEYQYSLYIYGPYSTELANDLDYIEFLDGVNVRWVPAIGGYNITPGDKCEHVCEKAEVFLDRYKSGINMAINEFGDKNAGELELIATIVYVDHYAKTKEQPVSFEKLVDEVEEIKPKFTKEYIEKTVRALSDKRYIQQS